MTRKSWLALPMLTLVLGAGVTGCRVRQTEEGELPKVEVKAKEGQMP
jgi:hypothetical protein